MTEELRQHIEAEVAYEMNSWMRECDAAATFRSSLAGLYPSINQ